MSIDVAALQAIDFHVHIEVDDTGHTALPQSFLDWSAKYFKSKAPRTPTLDEIAAHYRERRIAAVVFTVDVELSHGQPRIPNEFVAEGAARHSDILLAFACIDPARGRSGVRELERLIAEYGIKGMKFHPALQNFAPNDRTAYPLFEVLQGHGLPALFHTGQTGIGAGMPGGGGVKLRRSEPILLDDVAADFPDLPIVMAHPSVPWQDEAISVATHKGNVYIDLSGWSPKYFPPNLVNAANHMLRHKVLFASDYPVIDTDRWLADFAALDIKEEVRPLILKDNATRLLKLA